MARIVMVWATSVPAKAATALLTKAAARKPVSTVPGRPERAASRATSNWVRSPHSAKAAATKALTRASIYPWVRIETEASSAWLAASSQRAQPTASRSRSK